MRDFSKRAVADLKFILRVSSHYSRSLSLSIFLSFPGQTTGNESYWNAEISKQFRFCEISAQSQISMRDRKISHAKCFAFILPFGCLVMLLRIYDEVAEETLAKTQWIAEMATRWWTERFGGFIFLMNDATRGSWIVQVARSLQRYCIGLNDA